MTAATHALQADRPRVGAWPIESLRADLGSGGLDLRVELLLDRAEQFLALLRAGAEIPIPADPDGRIRRRTRQALRDRSTLHAGEGRPAGGSSAEFDDVHLRAAARMAPAQCAALDFLLFMGADPFEALSYIPAAALGLEDRVFTRVEQEGRPVEAPPCGFASLVLIAKLTRHCNLRCSYCNDWREGPGNRMSPEIQAQMIRRIAGDSEVSSARIVWHGGEPGLLGARRMLGFLWLQSRLKRPGQIIRNSVQTNAASLPDDVIALWKLFAFDVSVSIDGPHQIHDRQRRTIRGKGSFAAVRVGIGRLKDSGIFSGALIVTTTEIAGYPVDELVMSLVGAGIHRGGFLPVRPESGYGVGPYLTPDEFTGFLMRLFDFLRLNPDVPFDVRELDALHAAWQGRATGFCELGGPCLGSYFAIEPNGDIYHCDKFLGSDDYALGNIVGDDFAGVRENPKMARLRQLDRDRRDCFRRCRWYRHCRGWCPHEAHIAELRGSASDCCGLSSVFEHFETQAAMREPV